MTILSTKILTKKQKQLFNNSGIELIEYDTIAIHFLDFEAPKFVKNAIFTSQNAVRAILNKNIKFDDTFCVGEKTKQFLEKNGLKVTKMSKNASELGNYIKKIYKNEEFYFFSGTKRRNEIPKAFKNSKNRLFELKTYKTELNSLKFEQKWDGILFFSPSGIESYTLQNSLENIPTFCIGETTAKEAKKYTNSIFIAEKTTIESVIDKVNYILKND